MLKFLSIYVVFCYTKTVNKNIHDVFVQIMRTFNLTRIGNYQRLPLIDRRTYPFTIQYVSFVQEPQSENTESDEKAIVL